MSYNSLLILLCPLLFISCTSKNSKPILAPSYPNWYLTPVTNDSNYLYGIGKGDNLEEASQNALVNISSNLFLTIKSSSVSNKNSTLRFREYITKKTSNKVVTSTEELNYQNHEIVKIEKMYYNKFILLLRVKKSMLINSLKTELTPLDQKFQLLQKSITNPLSKYIQLLEYYNTLNSYKSKMQILSSLDSNYDSTFEKKSTNALNLIEKEKAKIKFSIIKNNSPENLVSTVKKSLSRLRFTIKKESDYKVILNSKITSKKVNGLYIANNKLSIDIKFKDVIINAVTYNLKGYSSISINDSIENIEYPISLNFVFDKN